MYNIGVYEWLHIISTAVARANGYESGYNQIRATPVRIKPPLQLRIPDDRVCAQSLCMRENESWICSGRSAVRASGGGRNSVDKGGEKESGESARGFLFGPSFPPEAFRLPSVTDTSDERLSSERFTPRPPIVRARTISNARNPTMSIVSSFCFRSRWGGRLRNSRKRLPGKKCFNLGNKHG